MEHVCQVYMFEESAVMRVEALLVDTYNKPNILIV